MSRFADVDRALVDHETFSSARGAIIELIKANIEIPPGVIIFEDPPIHDMHRKLLARMFTPRKINDLEPKIREFCAHSLDPLVGADSFDFVADLGAQMPMRVIGMLLGIPEEYQEAARDLTNDQMRTEAGKPMKAAAEGMNTGEFFADFIDWRAEHPSDDIMTDLLNVEFTDETGRHAAADPRGATHLHQRGLRRRQRDHHPADRLGRQGARRASRPAARTGREPRPDPRRPSRNCCASNRRLRTWRAT